MKMKMMYVAFAIALIAASVAYARRGPSSVFTFAVHPLAGYASQIGNTTPPPEAAPAVEPAALDQDEFDLFK